MTKSQITLLKINKYCVNSYIYYSYLVFSFYKGEQFLNISMTSACSKSSVLGGKPYITLVVVLQIAHQYAASESAVYMSPLRKIDIVFPWNRYYNRYMKPSTVLYCL